MQLQFLGATNTVTGSKYLLRQGPSSVLVDCGLFQGYKQLRLRNWAPMPVDPASIDAVILTRAHIDHSGYLLEEEAEYPNRHKLSKHAPALPLYTRDDAQCCLKPFEPVDYRTEWQPAQGLCATLAPTGHMPGSSFVRLDNGTRSIVATCPITLYLSCWTEPGRPVPCSDGGVKL